MAHAATCGSKDTASDLLEPRNGRCNYSLVNGPQPDQPSGAERHTLNWCEYKGGEVMGCEWCGPQIGVRNVVCRGIRYAGFAPILLLTCYAGFAAEPWVQYPNYYDQAPVVAVLDNPPPTVPKPLEGLGFGAGVAVSFGQSRVNNAVAVGPNNIVRVTDNSNVLGGIVFESHYFFVPPATQLFGSRLPVQWGSWAIYCSRCEHELDWFPWRCCWHFYGVDGWV